MGFSLKLVTREVKLGACPYITSENLEKLIDELTPPVREVIFGNPGVSLGGEEVMYRHEMRFFNPCVIGIDVSDNMDTDEIEKRISLVKEFKIERVGDTLSLDAIAIRCASSNPKKFSKTVKEVSEKFDGPLILCSFNAKILEEAVNIVKDRRPLLYAATEDNWQDLAKLSEKHDLPLVIHSQDLQTLGQIASSINHDNIVLDPGIIPVGSDLVQSLDRFTMLRKSAINGVKELGYPIMAVPAVVWSGSKDDVISAYYESVVGSMLMDRYASIMIIHSAESWSVLPLLTLRQNIFTDPRTEPQVEAKLYEIGSPNENSPVLVTTNFSLTYFTVEGDLRKNNIDAYLIVIETKGFAVDTALATGDLNASKIKEAIKKYKIEEKVNHKKMILPMFATQIRGQVEDDVGWEVLIGPRDSSGIFEFLKEHWK